MQQTLQYTYSTFRKKGNCFPISHKKVLYARFWGSEGNFVELVFLMQLLLVHAVADNLSGLWLLGVTSECTANDIHGLAIRLMGCSSLQPQTK